MKNELMETFLKVNNEYFGNANSLHKLGIEAMKLADFASNSILKNLDVLEKEIVYTSGRCESNNLAILGFLEKYETSKNIVVFSNAHSSIKESVFHVNKNIEIRFLKIEENICNIDKLESLIDNETVLVCFSFVDNLFDIINNFDKKKAILFLDGYSNVSFLSKFDLISIYDEDVFGIGALIKNKNIVLEPLIHGGKSLSIYRSGTPSIPLIVTFAKLIRLRKENKDE